MCAKTNTNYEMDSAFKAILDFATVRLFVDATPSDFVIWNSAIDKNLFTSIWESI